MGAGTGLRSSWFNLFSIRCIVLLLLNVTHCFSFVQTLAHFAECSALLQFKNSFQIKRSASEETYAYPKVASWTPKGGHQNQSNCCSWDGVVCDEELGHVIGLELGSSCLYGSINSNSSLFQLFHLQRLDLSDNHFNFSQIPSRLGYDLTSLTYLNLSQSLFSGQIPSEISKLSKLSSFDLSYNDKFYKPCGQDGGSIVSITLTKANLRSLVQNMTNLKQLHLSRAEIFSTFPDYFVNASSLTSLKLDQCGFYGEFPVGVFHLPNLEVLHVHKNFELTGYFPNFNSTNSFKKLTVGRTSFSGPLPTSIGNLRSLKLLSICFCNFDPHVPSSLKNLTQLFHLDVSSFYYPSPWREKNSFTMTDHSSLSDYSWDWVGKLAKLEHLLLAFTYVAGKFPCFLANLTQLRELDLGGNDLTGEIPSWVTRNLTQLTQLRLYRNKLSGLVEFDQFSNLKNLKELRLSFNQLSVQIKPNLNVTLKFQILRLGSCNLTEFPEFLKNQDELCDLGLFHNNIHGQIPKWFWSASRETLQYLFLSFNFFTGFESFDQNPLILPWKNMVFFEMNSNLLQGSLPTPPESIKAFEVANNDYNGEISPLFCKMNLQILDLANNNLSGMLPRCLGNSSTLQVLSLLNNSFDGDIPQLCPNKNTLRMVDLSFNHLQGKLPRSMAHCTQLEFLNLGNNYIRDTFPSWLGELPVLKALILRHNEFHGIIGKPATNHEFPNLCIIDLSHNGFSGMLPFNYLENWNFMKYVNETNHTYFEVIPANSNQIFYTYEYKIPVLAKGVELKYLQTPYLLRLIDLSSNRFEGEIPAGLIGKLRGLHLLNLSNNTLTGLIPSSLGNLTALESLDLSENQLSGSIPSNLVQLNFLEYFNVSHNHLWGPIPLGQQFNTFQEDSYQGNSGLCGKPLSKKCKDSESSTPPPPSVFEEDEDLESPFKFDWYMVLAGVFCGLIVGFVAGNNFADKKHKWFVDTFSKRMRQPRANEERRRQGT